MKRCLLAILTALLLICSLAISGCGGFTNSGSSSSSSSTSAGNTSNSNSSGESTTPSDYGTLTIANVSVEYGKTASIIPIFSNVKETIVYKFDGNDISIDGNVVTGNTAGAVVTVKALTAHLSTTFTVTVGKNYSFSVPNVTVDHGKTATISPVFVDESCAETLTYKFEGNDITINGNTVTGNVPQATVTVTATSSHYETTFVVSVGKNYVFSIADVSVEYGKTATISTVFEVEANAETITYSYDTSKISISGSVVTGSTAEAVVTVTATSAHHSTFFKVTVGKNYRFSVADVSVEYGKTATISPVFEVEANAENITYSYDTSKISISGNTVTGTVASSTVTVTATSVHHSTTFKVTVGQDWGKLTIADVSVAYNGTATISPVFSTVSEEITYEYDTSKISITGNTVKGLVANSTVTVTAKTDHVKTTFTVTIGQNYGTLSIANITTYKDFYAVANPVFSTISEKITYSFDSSKLSVSGNKFTGLAVGTHTVTASTGNVETSFTVTVNDNSSASALNSGFLNSLNSRINGYNSYNHDSGKLAMFIGDSFFDTQFFSDFYTRFAEYNAYTFGISATQARQWEWYVQKLYSVNPKTIVIHIGTNDIFDDGKDANEVTARLKRLFTNLHENLPNAKVYWFSIEPRRGSSDANGNAIAVTVNNNIKSYLSNGYATYMDSYTFFNANQTDTYYRDTVHPTIPLGYDKLMEVLSNSGHTFTTNSKFDGSIANWTTSTSDTFSSSKSMYFAKGQFLYTSQMTINSTNANGHITLNFNGSGDTRFLIWNNNNNSGKFYYGGAPEYATGSSYSIVGQTINVAVLKAQKHAYLFVDGLLQCVYLNAPTVSTFTVGSESCSITFANNKVYASTTSEYSTYLAKNGVSTYQNSSDTTSKIITDCSGTSSGGVLDDFSTVKGTDTFHTAKTINGASGKFVLGFNFIIQESDNNGHITINFNNDGTTRFLIWNHQNNGKFYFNGLNGGQYISSQYAQIGIAYHADILVYNKHAYMFINGTLQTVYANAPTVSSLTLGSESCSVYFGAITLYSSESDVYTSKITSQVTAYENGSYSNFVDVGTELPSIGQSAWNTVSGTDNFGTSKTIAGASGQFLITFKATINSSNSNGHLTFNFNNDGNSRFLLWDSAGKGYFYYCGFSSGNQLSTSKNYATVGTEVEISILVANKNAYMFINGTLQTVYYNVPSVSSITIGSESCSTSFSAVTVYNSSSNSYKSKLNTVTTYENSSESASKVVDVGT